MSIYTKKSDRGYSLFFRSLNELTGDNFNGTWFYDWNQLPENEYLLFTSFTSRSVNFSTALPMPMIYCSAINAKTSTSQNATVQNYPMEYIGSPINNMYETANVQFNIHENSLPVYLPSRPSNNNFNIRFVASNSDAEFAITAQQFYWVLQLNFVPYKQPTYMLNTTVFQNESDPRPFSVILNSVNGTVLDTNSYIQFEYNWANHIKIGNPYQEYNASFQFISMAQNMANTGQPAIIESDIYNSSSNFIVNYDGASNNFNSLQIGVVGAPSYEALSSLYSNKFDNQAIRTILPTKNIFYIKLLDFDVSTYQLWTPVTGATNDWVMVFYFNPI